MKLRRIDWARSVPDELAQKWTTTLSRELKITPLERKQLLGATQNRLAVARRLSGEMFIGMKDQRNERSLRARYREWGTVDHG
jgi:hypothetical protein